MCLRVWSIASVHALELLVRRLEDGAVEWLRENDSVLWKMIHISRCLIVRAELVRPGWDAAEPKFCRLTDLVRRALDVGGRRGGVTDWPLRRRRTSGNVDDEINWRRVRERSRGHGNLEIVRMESRIISSEIPYNAGFLACRRDGFGSECLRV